MSLSTRLHCLLMALLLIGLLSSPVTSASIRSHPRSCERQLAAFVLSICGSLCPMEVGIQTVGCTGYKRLSEVEVRDLCCPDF